MKDSKNLETSIDKREESSLINPEYLSLMYNSMYQAGQCYVCINGNHGNWGKVSEKVSRNKGLSSVDLYDRNMSLIGQYNTEDDNDTISYIFPDDDRGYEQLIMSLQRKQTVEDNYLIIINLVNNNGLVLRNRQKISVLTNVGYKNYQNEYTSDFWQHALSIALIDLECLYRSVSDYKRVSMDIVINVETLKILGIFNESYWKCRGNEYITAMNNNHIRSGISFSNSKDGIRAIEHKSDGSQLNINKFDTVYDLFDTYRPLLHDWRDKNIEYDYNQLGCTADEKYFKFRGQIQSDNRLRKPGDFIEIEKRSLYVEDRALNLLNIDGKKLSIETTSKDQEEIIEAFKHEQTASDQCPVYIKQKEKNILVIVQSNTIIIGRLEGEKTTDQCVNGNTETGDDLMLWQRFKIEYAFRNKVVDGVGLLYTWKFLSMYTQKFLKDYLKLQDEIYLCIEEYNSVQKQTSTILLYSIQTGEAIADRDKIIQLRKEFFKKIDRYSDRRGPDWKCLRETCSTAWDPRCDHRTTFEKRHDLYKTGGWNLVYQD